MSFPVWSPLVVAFGSCWNKWWMKYEIWGNTCVYRQKLCSGALSGGKHQLMHAASASHQLIPISSNYFQQLIAVSSLKLSALHLSRQLLCHSVVLPRCSLRDFTNSTSFLLWLLGNKILLLWYVAAGFDEHCSAQRYVLAGICALHLQSWAAWILTGRTTEGRDCAT